MRLIKIPFAIAGTSIGLGMAGQAFESTGLQEGGAAAGKFIAPAVNISAGGYVIKMLKDLKEK